MKSIWTAIALLGLTASTVHARIIDWQAELDRCNASAKAAPAQSLAAQ